MRNREAYRFAKRERIISPVIYSQEEMMCSIPYQQLNYPEDIEYYSRNSTHNIITTLLDCLHRIPSGTMLEHNFQLGELLMQALQGRQK